MEISVFSLLFTALAATVVVLFESLGMRRMVLVMVLVSADLMFGIDALFFREAPSLRMADTTGVVWYTLPTTCCCS